MNHLSKSLIGAKGGKNYNVPLLKSYAGYPVVSAQSLGLMDYFKNDGKQVGGMAWGGKSNPPGQGQGEPSSIVPNPYYYKNDPVAHNALVKLEASRHWMAENGYKPKFKITPQMQKWREVQFKNIGPAGESYLKDDNAFRETVISRYIGGDGNVPPKTADLQKEVTSVKTQLEELDKRSQPTIADMVMQAINIKK